jgi:hypothetical protein
MNENEHKKNPKISASVYTRVASVSNQRSKPVVNAKLQATAANNVK